MIAPLDFFRAQVDAYAGFVGNDFECEDKNLRAFASRDAFRDWYGQPPGQVGEPYRDEGFYTRELARVSQRKPKKIVEIGTANGIGTLLLRILNPAAELITIDNQTQIAAADAQEHSVGFLAASNGADYRQIIGESGEQEFREVGLCFIDGDHSYEAVKEDSKSAWFWRADKWAIVWHDHNDRHPGVMLAVGEFCAEYGQFLHKLPDSSTVWVQSEERP